MDLDARRVVITLTGTEQQRCTFTHRPIPPRLTDTAQISAAIRSTCAALVSGEARCWGESGATARLGDGTTSDSPVPATVVDEVGGGPLRGVESVAAGFTHACALLTSGQARCWGEGYDGELGDGTTATARALPMPVLAPGGTAPLDAITAIEAGSRHSCALLEAGEVLCWGSNASGALGDGTTTNRSLPVAVRDPSGSAALGDVAQISARWTHSCALLRSGQAVCWGDNQDGRLGDGTTGNRSLPVMVSDPGGTGPLTGITQISAGSTHTCALLESGEARCWGDNTRGGLGDGTTTDRYRPVVVLNADGTGPLTGITRLSAGGDQTCAVLDDGTVRCWGGNQYGELGDGTGADAPRPVIVVGAAGTGTLSDVVDVSAAYRSTCAQLAGGEVRCWGRNGSGVLGDGTTNDRRRPTPVIDPASDLHPLEGITDLASGDVHTCALLQNTQARCWGAGGARLGNPDVTASNVAVTVMDESEGGPLTGIAELTAGSTHTCALLGFGQARCWGTNSHGELGDGTTTSRAHPVVVSNEDGTGPLTGIVHLDAGQFHTCATLDDGEVRCWGDNSYGALGYGGTANQRLRPVAVVADAQGGHLGGVSAVSAATGKTCAVLTSGQARCWGSGRLGDGTTAGGGGSLPVVVSNPAGTGPLTDVTSIAVGDAAACATIADSQARCWGSTPGNGTATAALLPVVVSDPTGSGPLTDTASIVAGPTHTCAVLTTGQARCWGATNQWGELGTAPPVLSTLRPMAVFDPAAAGAMTGITDVATGDEYTCVVSSTGRARCVGRNASGTLGDGTTAYSRHRPVTVLEGPA